MTDQSPMTDALGWFGVGPACGGPALPLEIAPACARLEEGKQIGGVCVGLR
jgi:hypothetical protein